MKAKIRCTLLLPKEEKELTSLDFMLLHAPLTLSLEQCKEPVVYQTNQPVAEITVSGRYFKLPDIVFSHKVLKKLKVVDKLDIKLSGKKEYRQAFKTSAKQLWYQIVLLQNVSGLFLNSAYLDGYLLQLQFSRQVPNFAFPNVSVIDRRQLRFGGLQFDFFKIMTTRLRQSKVPKIISPLLANCTRYKRPVSIAEVFTDVYGVELRPSKK